MTTKTPRKAPLCGWLPCLATTLLLGVPAVPGADYASTILSESPVGYYRFEEPAGTTNLVDSSVYGVPATVAYMLNATNPTLGTLGIANSVNFNGTAVSGQTAGRPGTIDVPFRQEIAPTNTLGIMTAQGHLRGGAFSIECWARSHVNRTDGKYEGIVGVTGPNRSAYTPRWGGWILGKNNNARWVFLMRNGATHTGEVPTLMQWYHLVATFDGTNSALYVNGVLQSVAGESVNKDYVPSNYDGVARPANLGNSRYSDSPWMGFNGDVDEVAFYTNALTAAQVQTHYEVGTNSLILPAQPPVVLKNLTNTTAYANTPVTFGVQAGGDLPLSYQWFRGGAPIGGATNSAFTFTCAYPADNGAEFSVTITNKSGSTNSDLATLTVTTDLITAANPEDGTLLRSITRNVGSHAAFRPVAYGAEPIGYQWFRDGTPLPGATSATLWLTNVQMADSGAGFSVQVTNPWNSTLLSAYLYVQERPVNVPLKGYAEIVVADRPVAYWRLDDPAYSYGALDAVGSFDATYVDIANGAGLCTWEVPPGIPGETNLALAITNGGTFSVPFATELNPDGAWSAETWIRPDAVSANPNTTYVVFSSEYNHSTSSYNDWNGWYVTHGSSRTFSFIPLPASNAGALTAGPDDPAHTNQIVAGQWYHLVVSRDSTNFNLFINGKLRATRSAATTPFIPNGTGIRPQDGMQGHGATMIGSLHDKTRVPFAGAVDDTAIYNYALSQNQVLTHYLNSTNTTPPNVTVNIGTSGNKLVLTWSQGTLQSAPAVTGPFNDILPAPSSPYTNTHGATTFYRVRVR